MRVRLKIADVKIVLALLRREKDELDRETQLMEEETMLLNGMLREWRQKMRYEFKKYEGGYFAIKNRLAFLELQHERRWHYSETLRYLVFRYEGMLRGRVGRVPGVSDEFLDYHLKCLFEKKK